MTVPVLPFFIYIITLNICFVNCFLKTINAGSVTNRGRKHLATCRFLVYTKIVGYIRQARLKQLH